MYENRIALGLVLLICLLEEPVNGRILPRAEDCIGNVGGASIEGGNCSYSSSYTRKTRDEAMTCCETIPYRTGMPGSNTSGQAENFKVYLTGLASGQIDAISWTTMSYSVSGGLHHPTGPIQNGTYIWKHGTDLSQDHACIAAQYDNTVNLLLIYPEDCDKQLDFTCVTAIVGTCEDGEIISPIYDTQCTSECIKSTEAVSTTTEPAKNPPDTSSIEPTTEPTTDSPDTSNITSSTLYLLIVCLMAARIVMDH